MDSSESIDALARRISQLEAFLVRFGFHPERPPIQPSRPIASEIPVAQAVEPTLPSARVGPTVPPPLPRAATTSWRQDERGAWIEVADEPTEPSRASTPTPAAATPAVAMPAVSTPDVSSLAARLAGARTRSASTTPRSSAHTTVEQTLGLKLAGWIGAIVVAIGAAMGVKFAYDQGWLGNVPAEVKLSLLYAAGLAIVGLGEWSYRKVDPRAAVGLFAAGVASLFVVGYAGSAYFHLYGEVPAFALMAAACAIGAGIALRGGFVSIAVLSHLGANVAPLILRDRASGEVPLLAYLLALQVMALFLAHAGRTGRWWTLRTLVLVTTGLWVAGRLLQPATQHSTPTILFASLYALFFQLELVLLAHRSSTTPGTARSAFSAPTFSLAVTAAFAAELLGWNSHLPPLTRGACLIGLAMLLATAAASTLSSTTVAALRSLAASWLTQAALLVFVAVPIALDGPAITFAWAGLAVAYAALGNIVSRRRTVIAGGIVWIVAALHLLAATSISSDGEALKAIWLSLGGVAVPAYFVIALVLGVAGYAVAILAGTKRIGANDFAGVMAVAASAAWVVAALAALPPLVATADLVATAWILFAIGFLFRRPIYAGLALALAALSLAKWAAIDVLSARFHTPGATGGPIVFNPPMAVGAAGVASLFALLILARRANPDAGRPAVTWFAIVLGVLAMAIGLSVQVDRAASLAVARGSPWPAAQLTMLGLTVLWLAAVRVPVMVGRFFDDSVDRLARAQLVADIATILFAIKFLAVDSIGFAVSTDRVPAMPFANIHGLVALIVLGALWRSIGGRGDRAATASVVRVLLFAVPLVVGSIELDRAFGPNRTLIAWSIYWSMYAVASIVVGFWKHVAALRYAGLGLLAVTLLKIVLIDLAAAPTGWRILSFLAVGVVLLLTSVIYGKLSPRFDAQARTKVPL